MFVLLSVLVLTVLIALPNALAPVTLFEGTALLLARRTTFRGLILALVSFWLHYPFAPQIRRATYRRAGQQQRPAVAVPSSLVDAMAMIVVFFNLQAE